MDEIKDYVTLQQSYRDKLPDLIVGSLLSWYDCLKGRPVYYSRVTQLTSLGVYVDAYLPYAVISIIPWSLIRKTRYGFTFAVVREKAEYGYEVLKYKYPKPTLDPIKYIYFRNLK